ncbi:MAG: flagellar basal-body rod protein FlgG [Lachnospirales bacterium]
MMRSLWTGASGMTSQQLNVDVISNNIANVNTAGYKKERAEFETLLYQTLRSASTDVDNDVRVPNSMQVGHGVKPVAISRMFDGGSLEVTGNTFDFALQGDGFFAVQKGNDVMYTRDGTFKLSILNGTFTVVNSNGYPVLNTDNEPIEYDENGDFVVDPAGNLFLETPEGTVDLGMTMNITKFQNPQGLTAMGGNLFKESVTSGEPIIEAEEEDIAKTEVVQGVIEMSNVSIADEMVRLITAQRAYELNSKSITTSDEMLQLANNLKK